MMAYFLMAGVVVSGALIIAYLAQWRDEDDDS